MRKLIYFIILIIISISCTEKFELDSQINTNQIVIESFISDKDSLPNTAFQSSIILNYVRVSKVNPSLSVSNQQYEGQGITPVNNATVIISDNLGNIDTLLVGGGNININPKGYYYLQNFKGICGRTYYLYVKVGEQVYTSSTIMHEVVNLDSMHIPNSFISNKDGKQVFNEGVKVFFSDPINEKNYYLIKIRNGNWMYSIIDDRFLSSDINTIGYMLDDGENSKYWFNNYLILENIIKNGGTISVTMTALDKQSYYYYMSLKQQFTNDGGVYSPAPASPKGNISNGALGYFRASSISYISGRPR